MPEPYQLTRGGVLVVATREFIPEDPRNRKWRRYLNWLAGPNTPDPIPLTEERLAAKRLVDEQADERRQVYLPMAGNSRPFWWERRYEEAVAADADGTPTAAEYPLLDAEIPHTGATIAAVADAVLAEYAAARTQVALIEAVRLQAHADIDSAVDLAAIDAVLAGLYWPNALRPGSTAVALLVPAFGFSRTLRPDPVVVTLAAPAVTVT